MFNKSWKISENKVLHIIAVDRDDGEVSFSVYQVFVNSMDAYAEQKYTSVVQMTFNREEFLCLTQACNDQIKFMIDTDNQSVIDAVNKWLDNPEEL